jgi:hypothetical protein
MGQKVFSIFISFLLLFTLLPSGSPAFATESSGENESNPAIEEEQGPVLEDGRYVIASALSARFVVDVPNASLNKNTKMQIWKKNGSGAQIFDIKRQNDSFYTIRTLNSGAYLAAYGNKTEVATPIVQQPKLTSSAQRWTITKNNNGTFTFAAKRSGLVITVEKGKAQSGSKLLLDESKNKKSQHFYLAPVKSEPLVDGSLINLIPYSRQNLCVDIAGASRKNGAKVQGYKNNGTMAQKFVVKRVTENTFALQSLNSGLYLTVKGSNVIQKKGDRKGAPYKSQKWVATWTYGGFTLTNASTSKNLTLVRTASGKYTIKVTAASNKKVQVFRYQTSPVLMSGTFKLTNTYNRAIQINDRSVNAGDKAQVWKQSTSASQKWKLQEEKNGYYSIRCVRSNRVLDILNGSTKNGARVQLWNYNGSRGQRWKGVVAEGGWIYLKSASGMYLASTGNGKKSGAALKVTKNIKQALKLRLTPTSYSGPVGTYADVNLSTQKMMFVKNGVIVLESDIVTGAPYMATPTGTYRILQKQSPTVLVGPGYRSPVSYWMPFTRWGHGFHDANWQPAFGGNRWKNGFGSHGCVNMPHWAAKTLYKYISVGDTVRIHW